MATPDEPVPMAHVGDDLFCFACLDEHDHVLLLQYTYDGLQEAMPPATRRIACLTLRVVDDETMFTVD